MTLKLYKSISKDEHNEWELKQSIPKDVQFYANPFEALNGNPNEVDVCINSDSYYFRSLADSGRDDLDGCWLITKRSIPLDSLELRIIKDEPLLQPTRDNSNPDSYIIPH